MWNFEYLLSSHLQKQRYVYILEHQGKKGWYMIKYTMNERNNGSAAIWGPNQKLAVAFENEESVEQFKYEYMALRPVTVVRIDATGYLS